MSTGRIRAAIRRWLGVPTYGQVRTIVLMEIDADCAWKTGPHDHGLRSERRALDNDRDTAIIAGLRESLRG